MMRASLCLLLLLAAAAAHGRSLRADDQGELKSCGVTELDGSVCGEVLEGSLSPPQGAVGKIVLTANGLQTLRCRAGKWTFYDAHHNLYNDQGEYAGYFTVVDPDGDSPKPTLFLKDTENKTTLGSMVFNREGMVELQPEDPDNGAWYRRPITDIAGSACDLSLAVVNKLDTQGGGAGTTVCIEDRFSETFTKTVDVNATYVLYSCPQKAE